MLLSGQILKLANAGEGDNGSPDDTMSGTYVAT